MKIIYIMSGKLTLIPLLTSPWFCVAKPVPPLVGEGRLCDIKSG